MPGYPPASGPRMSELFEAGAPGAVASWGHPEGAANGGLRGHSARDIPTRAWSSGAGSIAVPVRDEIHVHAKAMHFCKTLRSYYWMFSFETLHLQGGLPRRHGSGLSDLRVLWSLGVAMRC